jgi:inhibitor of cysteine peptidase
MKTKLALLSVLLAGVLLFTACGSAPEALSVGAEANGTQVDLEVGQELVVTLESNPSTGYGWHVAEIDEGILSQVGETEYNQASGDEQLVGAPGTETLRFEAVASGTTTLLLGYDRVWESVPPEQTFTLTVVVK